MSWRVMFRGTHVHAPVPAPRPSRGSPWSMTVRRGCDTEARYVAAYGDGRTVGVGVIGRGFGKRIVAPVFAATEGCEVVDVVSPRDDDAVRALCDRTDVDLVAVHSPPFLPSRPRRRGARRRQGRAVRQAVRHDDAPTPRRWTPRPRRRSGRAVNFEFRHHPGSSALRDLVLDGAIGTLEHVQWTHVGAGSRVPLRRYGWLFDAERGGGWIGAWGSHADRLPALDLRRGRRRRRAAPHRSPSAPTPTGTCTRAPPRTGSPRCCRPRAARRSPSTPRFVAVKNVAAHVSCSGPTAPSSRSPTDGSRCATPRARRRCSVRPPAEDPHLVPMRAWAKCA